MTIPSSQQDVAAYLSALSGGPARETHISAVFIGDDAVWKLKKAVRMPFLDFSAVDARGHFLRRELELNKAAAPEIYRDVVAVSRRPDGSLELGGDNPVDWVLRMAPVPGGDFLDVIASRGALPPRLLDDLGDCIAAYHGRLPPVANWDSAGSLRRITEGNVASALAAGLPGEAVSAWRQAMVAAINSAEPWLSERAAHGYVRRCHGDLHLGNLCLWRGKPVPFDALEFDETLGTIDVAYDLAFLLMDLDRRLDPPDGRAAANRVMNRYVARTGDIFMRGLPCFLSQRAMIRAHVLQAMGGDGLGYLAAARAYLEPVPPIVVAIGGLQGTGKSTLSRALAPELGPAPGALIVRSDEVRKRLHGAEPETRLAEAAYSEAANAATNAAVIDLARRAAVCGHSVVVDATFLDLSVREELTRVIQRTGVAFLGVWLDAPLSVLQARVGARTGDASDATVAVLQQSAANNPGAVHWTQIDATDGGHALRDMRHTIASQLFHRDAGPAS